MSTREPWPEEVRYRACYLRSLGWTYKEISAETGAPKGTIHRWITDPDGTKARARKDSYGGRCEVCGKKTSGANGRGTAAKRCLAHNHHAIAVHAEAEAWKDKVEAEWNAGGTPAEVAARLGMNTANLANHLHRMRERGRIVRFGYERRPRERARAAREEQVIEMWRAGVSGVRIAKRFGVTPGAIYDHLARLREQGVDLPVRSQNGYTKKRMATMSDGADLGVSAHRALETVLGGKPEPTENERVDMAELERRIRSRPLPDEVPARGLGYSEMSECIAHGFLVLADEDPELLTRIEHYTGHELDGSGDAVWWRENMTGVAKEPDAAMWNAFQERWPEADCGASGFMVGWAFNAVRAIKGLSPVQNPAIVTVGGKGDA
jgi:DNA-binding CsgD family transcriptional regulator